MNLYLVRHAEGADAQVDPERKLTEQGLADAHALAKLLAAMGMSVTEIWHSPKPRAAQTAQAIAAAIGATEKLAMRDGLLSYDRVKPLARELRQINGDLMIVGHDPFLTRLASKLLIRRASVPVVDLGKPGLLHLVRQDDASWRISQLLAPPVLRSFSTLSESP